MAFGRSTSESCLFYSLVPPVPSCDSPIEVSSQTLQLCILSCPAVEYKAHRGSQRCGRLASLGTFGTQFPSLGSGDANGIPTLYVV